MEMKAKLAKQRGLPPPVEETAEEEQTFFLPAHLDWIWSAFAILSRTRLVNEAGPQPITILEIDSYCTLECIWSEDERRNLLHHLTLLDIEWLRTSHENIRKAREDARKEAEKAAKRKSPPRRG
jgi:hypothetical protein